MKNQDFPGALHRFNVKIAYNNMFFIKSIVFDQLCYNKAMNDLQKITQALHASWSQETSYGGAATIENPARGQCVVSSLVIQDYLGGDLRRVRVRGGGIDEKHYFNVLNDGMIIDTTGSQYANMKVVFVPLPINRKDYVSVRDKLFDDDTRRRYELLRQRVDKYLAREVI